MQRPQADFESLPRLTRPWELKPKAVLLNEGEKEFSLNLMTNQEVKLTFLMY